MIADNKKARRPKVSSLFCLNFISLYQNILKEIHFLLSYPRLSLSLMSRYLLKAKVSVPFLCSIEAQKVDQLVIYSISYLIGVTCPIGINPRPASASRALLRLTPCHRAYRKTTYVVFRALPTPLS
jgi:hypothetical protein